MSKGSDAIKVLWNDAKARQQVIAAGVHSAEKTLVKRRAAMAVIDAEVRELEADLAALRRVALQIVANG